MIPFLKGSNFDIVAGGKKANAIIDRGVLLHKVTLIFGNAAVAANGLDDLIDDIVVKYGGKPQRVHTASELNHLNAIHGAQYAVRSYGTDGQADRVHYLDIWFANPWRKISAEQFKPSWRLKDQGIQIEVGMKAGLTAPHLRFEMEADFLPANSAGIGLIQKVKRDDYNAVGTSRTLQTLERLDTYMAMHFLPTVGGTSRYVTKVKLRRDSFDIVDEIELNSYRGSLTAWGMNPDQSASPWFELVLNRSNGLRHGMQVEGAREFRAEVEFSGTAAGSMRLIREVSGSPD